MNGKKRRLRIKRNCKKSKKPVGAKPGKVIYHVYNTAFVTPDSAEAEKLAVKV